MGRRSPSSPVVIALVAAALLAACRGGPLPGEEVAEFNVIVENRTATPLTFEMVLADRTLNLMGPIEVGQTGSIVAYRGRIAEPRLDVDADGCMKGLVVAFDPQRREVARHPPGLCVGETWVIESRPTPS